MTSTRPDESRSRATRLPSIILVVCLLLAAGTAAASSQTADRRQDRVRAGVARVYDTSVLHRIDIVIAPADAQTILNRTTERVRCTLTFDGVVLKNVGIRQAGGTFNQFVPIDQKPTLSVKFDDFIEGQELYGLEKIVLKDGRQDTGLVGEHLTYEVYLYAVEAATSNYDGFSFNTNNAYLYAHPKDGRLITINRVRAWVSHPLNGAA